MLFVFSSEMLHAIWSQITFCEATVYKARSGSGTDQLAFMKVCYHAKENLNPFSFA